jgi:alpha-glucosidase (family GH31 glycosyl hydrolase)
MNRWIEVGNILALMLTEPFDVRFFRHQEPYRACSEKTLQNYRKWVYFRYRLVPYLYDLPSMSTPKMALPLAPAAPPWSIP